MQPVLHFSAACEKWAAEGVPFAAAAQVVVKDSQLLITNSNKSRAALTPRCPLQSRPGRESRESTSSKPNFNPSFGPISSAPAAAVQIVQPLLPIAVHSTVPARPFENLPAVHNHRHTARRLFSLVEYPNKSTTAVTHLTYCP